MQIYINEVYIQMPQQDIDITQQLNDFVDKIKGVSSNQEVHITKEEPKIVQENTTPTKQKSVIKGHALKNLIKENPNQKYQYPKSYIPDVNWRLENGLIKTGKSQYETYNALKLFYAMDSPLTLKCYDKVNKLIKSLEPNQQTCMRFVHRLDGDMQRQDGEALKLIWNIFSNDYAVPKALEFKYTNNLLINDEYTNIKKTMLKQWIDELNDSLNPPYTILKIMHENQKINQKYLWYTLNNYGNQHILKIIGE